METSQTSAPSSEPDDKLTITSPRTIFVEFPEVPTGREFVKKLGEKMATGVYSINAPTGSGGCRVAVQIESAKVEEAHKVATEMGGKPGAVATPKRTAAPAKSKPQQEEPADDTKEGDSGMPGKKKGAKKSGKSAKAVTTKAPSPRFAKKTACDAPGHGEYGDIESHNKKHHAGKAFVAKGK
jgi:hypothetical protein